MRKLFVTLMTSLLSCSAAFAFWPEAADSSLDIGVGYKRGTFKWGTGARTSGFSGGSFDNGSGSFDGDDSFFDDGSRQLRRDGRGRRHRNLRSHLEWKNLNIWEIQAKGRYITCDNIYLRGEFDYGWITSGRVRDSDFDDHRLFNDGRRGRGRHDGSEFSRSRSKSDRGYTYDAKLAVGYQFKMCDDSFGITPVVGYGWTGQHLKMKHGRQHLLRGDRFARGERLHGLNSKYTARWNGPFVGLDFDYRFACDWSVFATYEYHWARYKATGRWNLRQDFDLPNGFRHNSKRAYGQVATLGVKWDFCDCWTASLVGEFQYWQARRGKDRHRGHRFVDGDVNVHDVVSTRLRDVRWETGAVYVDVGMAF